MNWRRFFRTIKIAKCSEYVSKPFAMIALFLKRSSLNEKPSIIIIVRIQFSYPIVYPQNVNTMNNSRARRDGGDGPGELCGEHAAEEPHLRADAEQGPEVEADGRDPQRHEGPQALRLGGVIREDHHGHQG